MLRQWNQSKLTDGIVQELAERYSGQDSLSYDALLQDFGSPDEIALEMQENVNPQEVVSVKKKRKVIAAALIVLAVVAFLALGYVTWNVFQDQQTWAVEQIRDYRRNLKYLIGEKYEKIYQRISSYPDFVLHNSPPSIRCFWRRVYHRKPRNNLLWGR